MNDTMTITGRELGELNMPGACRCCFWTKRYLKRLRTKPPFQFGLPGIFNSIDIYTKGVIHECFKHGRAEYLSSICDDLHDYVDPQMLHWKRFGYQHPETKIRLIGMPDDIFIAGDASYHIVDYKTARYTEKQHELAPIWETQLQSYAFIAERAGLFRPVKSLTLVFMEPLTGDVAAHDRTNWLPRGFKLGFAAQSLRVELDLDKIPPLLRRAREITALNNAPKGVPGCEECERLADLVSATIPF